MIAQLFFETADIAREAEKFKDVLLKADERAEYDRVIEIDLSTVSDFFFFILQNCHRFPNNFTRNKEFFSYNVINCRAINYHVIKCNVNNYHVINCYVINYHQLEPHVNGPMTPDLGNPISKLGEQAHAKGWPMNISVGEWMTMMIIINYA